MYIPPALVFTLTDEGECECACKETEMGVPRNGVHVVLGEMSMVVSSMRRTSRFAGATDDDQDPLLQGFATLKLALSGVTGE